MFVCPSVEVLLAAHRWLPRWTPGGDMQPFEYRSVRYWPKEINGTLTGERKKIFFLIRDIDGPATTAASMESCRLCGAEVSLRSPRVVTVHVQAPTPHAPGLGA